MSTEHVIITDPNIHETKGASSAAVDNILIADGAGSATWQPVTNAVADAYAKLVIFNNSTIVAVPTAVDATLHTATDYVDMTLLFTEDFSINMTVNPVTGIITIPINGVYKVNAWASISSSAANSLSGYALTVNGVSVAAINPVIKVKMKTAGDISAISGFGINTFSAGDLIGIAVSDDTGANITVHESIFSINLERKS